MAVGEESTLTLRDVADLARVSRPVVSMWRRRPQVRGRALPFPSPVTTAGGVLRFDRDEIVTWLEETGRGNNKEARQDAPALSVPDQVDIEDVVTLLCLHTLTGAELGDLSAAQLIELAERADPDDRSVLREVRALRGAPRLARYVDDLVEASYGVSDALLRLESSRLRRSAAERGPSTELVGLLRTVALACRAHLGDGPVALVPPADDRLGREMSDGFDGVLMQRHDGPARAQRRRAVVNGVELVDAARGAVRMLSVVGDTEADALEAADELVLSLGPTDVGMVLGAASVLCDPLVGDAEGRRSQTLRPGNLAIAVRLPRGLWKAAHRQSLALWVLDGGRSEQWLRMADLAANSIDPEDLASDVTAALQRTDGRAYRYARRGDLAPVLAGGPVVPRGVRAVRLGAADARTHLDRIHTATLTTSEPMPGYDVTVAPAPGQVILRRRSLGELVDAGQIVVKRGSRVSRTAADPRGTVRVMSGDSTMDDVRLDPLDAVSLYPRAVRTEPGDVVFAQRPRPIARVDAEGGALVASPSRLLRLRPTAALGPYALAALINQFATEGSEWQTWSVPELPPSESDALDAALSDATRHLAVLHRHVRAVQDLTTSLIEGVAAGAVTFDATITERAG